MSERKSKVHTTPDARGDQDNQDKSDFQGKKPFYPKFFANQQHPERNTHLMEQSQASATCDTSRPKPYQFSTFKPTPGQPVATDPNSLGFSDLTVGHHEVGRKHTNYNSTHSRNYLSSPSHVRETSPNTSLRPLDTQSYFFHGHKTEKNINRETDELDDLGAVGGLGISYGTNKNETGVSMEPSNVKKLSTQKKKLKHRSLDSLKTEADIATDARSIDHLPSDNRPRAFVHENQQSVDSTKPKLSFSRSLPKLKIFQKLRRSFNFLDKEKDKELSQENEDLTAKERCKNDCSQNSPQNQVFMDRIPILRDGSEINVFHQESLKKNLIRQPNAMQPEINLQEERDQRFGEKINITLNQGRLMKNLSEEPNRSRILQATGKGHGPKSCELQSSATNKGIVTHDTTSESIRLNQGKLMKDLSAEPNLSRTLQATDKGRGPKSCELQSSVTNKGIVTHDTTSESIRLNQGKLMKDLIAEPNRSRTLQATDKGHEPKSCELQSSATNKGIVTHDTTSESIRLNQGKLMKDLIAEPNRSRTLQPTDKGHGPKSYELQSSVTNKGIVTHDTTSESIKLNQGKLKEDFLEEPNRSETLQATDKRHGPKSCEWQSSATDKDIVTQETTSGNIDSLEIGYSISQLGRYYLQNPNNLEKMRATETMACGESWERCLGWITKVDLDALSRGTNSSDSLGHTKPEGKLDIIKGILLDIFVCICF